VPEVTVALPVATVQVGCTGATRGRLGGVVILSSTAVAHLGAIFERSSGHSFFEVLEASVQAMYKLVILIASPHLKLMVTPLKSNGVILLAGKAGFLGSSVPLHPSIGDEVVLPPLVISKVPKKANAVRSEPVVLLISKVSCRVISVSVSHSMHVPSVSVALDTYKSFDTHLSGAGRV